MDGWIDGWMEAITISPSLKKSMKIIMHQMHTCRAMLSISLIIYTRG